MRPQGFDLVAVLLAVAVFLGLVLICSAALWLAVADGRDLNQNVSQLIATPLGAIIGVLGSYLGFKAGQSWERRKDDESSDNGL